jgi:nucleotide-binding universal stress UspA family protein
MIIVKKGFYSVIHSGFMNPRILKNTNMKKILVPTDYSDCANSAMEVAKEIALKSGAELLLIHLEEVVPEVAHVLHHAATEENPHHVGHARLQLQSLVDSLGKEGIKTKGVFVPNEGRDAIEDYLEPYGIDFMVMGSHGATGIRELLIGSKTQKVIRHVNIPVLVVKHPVKKFGPKKILFASTFRDDVSKPLRMVADFAKLWNAELELVFLNMLTHLIEENEAKQMMINQMNPFSDISYSLNISETNDEEWGISKFARVINADVIAVVFDTHTGFNRLFNSGVAEKLINHESIPVLVMSHK